MGKSKEEDRIERIIRGLLKLPENRRCINCNSLGPQYVCTTFWTFVCTNCSGVHREFTHRVKSISMAKFSMEEVSALQAGGNEKARQIYFKTWDPHHNQIPDTSNIPRIRDTIKQVYVDRQYTGEARRDSVPRSQNSGSHDPHERKRGVSSDRSTFRAKNIDRNSRYSYDEIKIIPHQPRENFRYDDLVGSPQLDRTRGRGNQVDDPRDELSSSREEGRHGRLQVEEEGRQGSKTTNSYHFEISYGRYKVDSTRVAGRAATQMFTTEDIKPRMRSPDRNETIIDMSNPTASTVKEVLGENSIALRVSNYPKFVDTRRKKLTANAHQEGDRHKQSHKGGDDGKTSHRRTVSANAKDTAPESGSQPSFNNNAELKPNLPKSGSSSSLLAISDAPSTSDEPIPKPPDPQTNQTIVPLESVVNESSRNVHPKNTLEFLLFELATPAENPSGDQAGNSCDKIAVLSPSTTEPPTLELVPVSPRGPGDSSHVATADELTGERMSSAPSAAAATSIPARSTDSHTMKVANCDTMLDLLGGDVMPATEEAVRKEYSSTQHLGHSSTLFSDESSSAAQTSHSKNNPNKQPTMSYQAQSSQPDLGPPRETQSSVGTQPSHLHANAGGRKELPAEIFAFPYQSSSMSASSGWQAYPNYGMGYNMHYYPPQMQMPPYPNMVKSRNPFDTNEDTIQTHANKFVSKEFMQGGLTNMLTPAGMSHTTNLGSHFMGFASPTGPPAAYPSMVQHQPPGASAGTYLGQHSYQQRPPSSNQGAGSFGSGELGPTMSIQPNQQVAYRLHTPADQSSFPRGRGNPFG